METASSGSDPVLSVGVVTPDSAGVGLAGRFAALNFAASVACPYSVHEEAYELRVPWYRNIHSLLRALGNEPVLWLTGTATDIQDQFEEIRTAHHPDVTLVVDGTTWGDVDAIELTRNWGSIYGLPIITVQRSKRGLGLDIGARDEGTRRLHRALPLIQALLASGG